MIHNSTAVRNSVLKKVKCLICNYYWLDATPAKGKYPVTVLFLKKRSKIILNRRPV